MNTLRRIFGQLFGLDRFARDTSGGTARRATVRELRKGKLLGGRGDLYLGAVKGVLRWRIATLPDQTSGDGEALEVIGPAGSGKTTYLVDNILGQIGQDNSAVINDPKLDIFLACAPGLAAGGHRILIFAPLLGVGDRYDPLAQVTDVDEARRAAEDWISAQERSTAQPFFDRLEQALLGATLWYHKIAVPGATIQDVRTFVTGATAQAMLGQFQRAAERYQDAVLATMCGTLIALMDAPEARGGVLAGFGGRFDFLASARLRAATSGNDIWFQDLLGEPTILFISIPPSDGRTGGLVPLANNVWGTLLRRVQEAGGSAQARLERPLRVYIDEASSVAVPHLSNALKTLRAKGATVVVAHHGIDTLIATYEEREARAIRAAASTHALLPGAPLEDCRFMADVAGMKTAKARSGGRQPGARHGLWGGRASGWSSIARYLKDPSELRRLPRGEMFVVSKNMNAFQVRVRPYFAYEALRRALAEARRALAVHDPHLADVVDAIERGRFDAPRYAQEPDVCEASSATPSRTRDLGTTGGAVGGKEYAPPRRRTRAPAQGQSV